MSRIKQLVDWLDHRTGIRDHIREGLYENIPGGSRWRYVWGSTLMFALMVQFITGAVLWMAYSPSTLTAWESVYYIQHEMAGGWFLRGIHHWMSQVMIVLLVLHLMQVVIDGAYKAPREVNYWFGVGLLMLVLGLSLTGYLLPWDQKGYWATSVATDIMAATPLIGEWLKQVVIGWHDYGHHTLTRFFALHAGILPGALIALTAGHIYLFRRHGVKDKQPHRTQDEFFWPEQVLKDGVACLAVLAVVLFFVIREHGAHLDPPADPSSSYQARPDWVFLSLFQLLKYVPEFVGAFLIPGLVMTLIILMPMIGKWELGHRFNVGLLFAVLLGAGALTWLSVSQDQADPQYRKDMAKAKADYELVVKLAGEEEGIPPAGALALLHAQENTGPKLFAKHCAACHAYDQHNGLGEPLSGNQTAPDLKGFASRKYLTELLHPERFASPKFFGNTAHVTTENNATKGKMVRQLTKLYKGIEDEDFTREEFNQVIMAISAEAELPSQKEADKNSAIAIEEGLALFEDMSCIDCHTLHRAGEQSAPDLTGYGSREWMLGIVHDPAHDRFYGKKNDRMPAFGKDGRLTRQQMEAIVDWLREP